MLKQFEVFRISFIRNEDGMIEKQYQGIIAEKDYEDIEKGLASVIEYVTHEKQLPENCTGVCCPDDTLLTIIFKRNAMRQFNVETLSAQVELNDLENVLSGLMFMQIKIHLDKLVKSDIKLTLKQDDSISPLSFATDDELT